MHAVALDLPPHIVRQTDDVDLFLLPFARAQFEEMRRQAKKFAPALDDVEIEEEDEGLWC